MPGMRHSLARRMVVLVLGRLEDPAVAVPVHGPDLPGAARLLRGGLPPLVERRAVDALVLLVDAALVALE